MKHSRNIMPFSGRSIVPSTVYIIVLSIVNSVVHLFSLLFSPIPSQTFFPLNTLRCSFHCPPNCHLRCPLRCTLHCSLRCPFRCSFHCFFHCSFRICFLRFPSSVSAKSSSVLQTIL